MPPINALKTMKSLFLSAVLLVTVTGTYAQNNLMNKMAEKTALTPGVVVAPADTTAKAVSDTAIVVLDQAVAASKTGDKSATVQALQTGATALETEAKTSTGSFKDKLTGQAGNLKKLIPAAKSGLLNAGVLQKAVSLAKMAFAANKIEKLMGGSNLLGSIGGLTSNLGVLQSVLPALGGGASGAGGSLISSALSSVSQLNGGGQTATAAEPALRGQLTSVLGFVKGVL